MPRENNQCLVSPSLGNLQVSSNKLFYILFFNTKEQKKLSLDKKASLMHIHRVMLSCWVIHIMSYVRKINIIGKKYLRASNYFIAHNMNNPHMTTSHDLGVHA